MTISMIAVNNTKQKDSYLQHAGNTFYPDTKTQRNHVSSDVQVAELELVLWNPKHKIKNRISVQLLVLELETCFF